MTMSLRFFRLFSADHSSEERLENLVSRLNLSLLISWRHFLMKKSKDESWPLWEVHLNFRIWSVSKVSLFEVSESSALSWKEAFNWTRRRNFSTSCLTENLSVFLDMGTKFKPLLRTDFSESESSKFYGMVTTVLRFSGDESLVIWGPISWSSFWALIWYKFLKSLELASWIFAWMDSTKTAGQINRYSMFGKRNKSDSKTLCVFH